MGHNEKYNLFVSALTEFSSSVPLTVVMESHPEHYWCSGGLLCKCVVSELGTRTEMEWLNIITYKYSNDQMKEVMQLLDEIGMHPYT